MRCERCEGRGRPNVTPYPDCPDCNGSGGIAVCDFVVRINPEPESDKLGLMDAFDEMVTGPVDNVHIERMSDGVYWARIEKGNFAQVIVFSSASGRAKVVARTEADVT